MHSKAKLALAVFTSPGAAFEEILERKLLGTGLVVTAAAGAVASVPFVLYGYQAGPLQFLALGKQNPLCWLGLCMLYALVLERLLKWIGTQIDFVSMLTVMGWSQLALLLSQVIIAMAAAATAATGATGSGTPNEAVASFVTAAAVALPIWYVVLVGMGVRAATDSPLSRGIMTYVVVALSAQIAFRITYGSAFGGPLPGALPGVDATAGTIAMADQTPWLAAGVIGLVLGIWQIGKRLEWDGGTIVRAAVSAGLIGAVAFGAYVYAVWFKTDYYRKLAEANVLYVKAQRLYDNNKVRWVEDKEGQEMSAKLYRDAAGQLEDLLPISKNNVVLALDIGDLYYLAGDSDKAIENYSRYIDVVKRSPKEDEKRATLARIYTGIGAVYDADGNYDAALKQFKKATGAEPKFRDAWVRMAITYDRMGNYKEAIEAADKHAIRELDSEAAPAWLALAQAFVATGDKKQAETAIAMVADKDSDLAKRIGDKADDWKDAVGKLTREDLQFPLEEKPLAPPEEPESESDEKPEAGKQEPDKDEQSKNAS